MSENLNLKSIGDILEIVKTIKKDFYIPAYQRGYRWEKKQVIELLEDISSFSKTKKKDDFYCLQPIVVNQDEKNFRVIDGQQRLTTIYIILKYFNEVEFKKPKPVFNLVFETRPSNESFFNILDNTFLENNKVCEEDIDKFYMSSAFIEIDKWFIKKIEKNPSFIQDFYPILLNDIKIIWYKVDSKNEIDVFTRLNIGKIPLTNAELIKALFLMNMKDVKDNDNESEKILLASQWDDIEYRLQDKEFFAFINGKEFNKPTKIEYIFDLIAESKEIKIENLAKDDDKYSFYIFNELIKNKYDSKNMWDEVKTYFRIFNELYANNTYYHLVGFITQTGGSIKDIIDKFKENNKRIFKNKLDKLIINEINLGKKVLKKINDSDEELKYGSKKDEDIINKILFLFNVVSTIKSGYSRYPFDKHKNEKWSLEHIHAQQSEKIIKDEDRKQLLTSQLDYIEESNFKDSKSEQKIQKLKQQINNLLNSKEIETKEFEEVQEKIFQLYSDNSSVHTIDNLALLGRDDNSSLNNSIFPAKRDKIKKLDKLGSFIPIGTKNVFLKYYSDDVKNALTWNKEDRKLYLNEIEETLKIYIGGN